MALSPKAGIYSCTSPDSSAIKRSAFASAVSILSLPVTDSKEPLALTAVGGSTPALAKFDPASDKARWNFRKP